jgi:hypothetical protein
MMVASRPKHVGDYQYVIKHILPSAFFGLLYRIRKNSMSVLREVIGGTKTKDLLSRNCMSEILPCSANGSD